MQELTRREQALLLCNSSKRPCIIPAPEFGEGYLVALAVKLAPAYCIHSMIGEDKVVMFLSLAQMGTSQLLLILDREVHAAPPPPPIVWLPLNQFNSIFGCCLFCCLFLPVRPPQPMALVGLV